MMMLCSKQIHLTALSGLLTCVSIALFNNRHFAVRVSKAHSKHLLARGCLQLKTRSSHDISFLAKAPLCVFRGQACSPRMMKGISVPLTSKFAGIGKVDFKSSKK